TGPILLVQGRCAPLLQCVCVLLHLGQLPLELPPGPPGLTALRVPRQGLSCDGELGQLLAHSLPLLGQLVLRLVGLALALLGAPLGAAGLLLRLLHRGGDELRGALAALLGRAFLQRLDLPLEGGRHPAALVAGRALLVLLLLLGVLAVGGGRRGARGFAGHGGGRGRRRRCPVRTDG